LSIADKHTLVCLGCPKGSVNVLMVGTALFLQFGILLPLLAESSFWRLLLPFSAIN